MGDEMDDDAKLTDRTPAPGLRVVHSDWCGHHRMTVNPNTRKLTCDSCNAELDPYKELAMIAHNSENVRQWADAATLAGKRLKEIERLERNARSRLKRLGEEVPDKDELDDELCGTLAAKVDDGDVVVWITFGLMRQAIRRMTPDEAAAAGEKLQRLAWQARNG